jgi:hypothetical protein
MSKTTRKVSKKTKPSPARTNKNQSEKEIRNRKLFSVTVKGILGTIVLFSLIVGYIKYQSQQNINKLLVSNKSPDLADTQKSKTIVDLKDKGSTLSPIKNIEAIISGNNVVIRETPKLNGKVVSRAIFGTSVEIIEVEEKWAKIHSPGQKVVGWVEKSYLNF